MSMHVYDFHLKTISGDTENTGPHCVTLELPSPPDGIKLERHINKCFKTDGFIKGFRLHQEWVATPGNSHWKWTFRDEMTTLYESAVAYYEPHTGKEWAE